MLKIPFIYLAIGILISCSSPKNPPQTDKIITNNLDTPVARNSTKDIIPTDPINYSQLIIPGKRIGQIEVGEDQAKAMQQLGKPDFQDAAMGSSLMTWYANHDSSGYQTSIFSSHHFGQKDENKAYIKKILVSSPWFKTVEGDSVGSTKANLAKKFTLKLVDNGSANNKKIDVYSDTKKGISFEVNKATGKCVSIIVHAAGEEAGTYINMHER